MKKIIFILLIFSCFKSNAQTLNDCSVCSSKTIKQEQIKNLSIDEIRFLTNDLFARRGYKFKISTIDNYFSMKTWYKPTEDNNRIEYNSIEKQNIKLFQERTKELKEDREKLIEDLKLFKVALLQNNEAILGTNFNFSIKKILGEKNSENHKYFLEVIRNLNIDEIGWFKKQAHYKKKIDNLSETYSYEVIIKDIKVYFRYDYDSGSEEIKDDLYPSDIFQEFTYFWNFEFINNQLKFLDFGAAG